MDYTQPKPTSKRKPYARAYKRTYYTTITATVSREMHDEFRKACQTRGVSMHAAIKAFAKKYIRDCETDDK